MTLKAVLFDFNGVILDDEPLHQQIILELLQQENLSASAEDFQRFCLGRNDRTCFRDLFASRGRVVSEAQMRQLLVTKAQIYKHKLAALETLPLFAGLPTLLAKLRQAQIKLAIVSGALRSEIRTVLHQAQMMDYFDSIVGAEDVEASKPNPEGYHLVIQRLNRQYSTLQLEPTNCLAIEDSFAGIQAAKQAQIPVVGVAHTYPFHMLQRRANWVVDGLDQLEFDRIQSVFAGQETDQVQDQDNPDPK